MLDIYALIENLQKFGVGRRNLEDKLFSVDKVPARLGIYDEEEEDSCHEVARSTCTVPGCAVTALSLLDLEKHYNTAHRYRCGECKRALPSPHLLDLHVQETHDSFFAAMAARRPSYCCYVQECTSKFLNTEQRLEHGIKVHKLPKDFRFEIKPKKKSNSQNARGTEAMDVDAPDDCREPQNNFFHNNKQKGLIKYCGKKFTSDTNVTSPAAINVSEIMSDLRKNLPK